MLIKQKRLERNLTQQQLSDLVHTKRSNIARYENGSREPDVKMLKRLAKALNCTVDKLIADEKG